MDGALKGQNVVKARSRSFRAFNHDDSFRFIYFHFSEMSFTVFWLGW